MFCVPDYLQQLVGYLQFNDTVVITKIISVALLLYPGLELALPQIGYGGVTDIVLVIAIGLYNYRLL